MSSEAAFDEEVDSSTRPRASARVRNDSMKGRLGFGAMRSVSAVNAMFVSFFPARKLSLGLVFGVATFSHREASESGEFDKTRTVGQFGAGPEVFVWPVLGSRENQIHADVGLGLRGLIYWGFLGDDGDDDETLDTPLEIAIEVPAALRVFIGRHVNVTPEFGLVARIVPGSREPDTNNDADDNPGSGAAQRLGTTNGPGFGFELGNHTGLFMGISVSYFFQGRGGKASR